MFGKKDPNYKKKTSIIEDRFTKRSVDTLVKELEPKSFAEEIEQDKNKSAVLIGRAERAEGILGSTKASGGKFGVRADQLKQEVESVAVYKRALMMMGSSGMTVTSERGREVSASENNLPVSSYLSHGSRTMIQIPPGSNDDLINWLTSGDTSKDGRSRSQDPNKAMSEKEPKYVYNRAAATHDVAVTGSGKVIEKKGFTIGLKDFLNNKILGKKTKHWGVDLAVDAEFGGLDSAGNRVNKPDGDHGHLYIHYTPATKDTPGSIMIGMEGAAPYSSKHSKIGASDPISPTGASKFDDLAMKKKATGEPEYDGTVVPKKYNGIHASLKMEDISSITKLNAKDFSIELAEAIPGKSSGEFVGGINQEKFHKKPVYKETRKTEITAPKPSAFKNFANKITFGYAYKKEINEYKAERKVQAVQRKVATRDSVRVESMSGKESTRIPLKIVDKTQNISIGSPSISHNVSTLRNQQSARGA